MVDSNMEFCFYGVWSSDQSILDKIKHSDELRTLKEQFNYYDCFIQLYSGYYQEEPDSDVRYFLSLGLLKIQELSDEQMKRLDLYDSISSCMYGDAFCDAESITPDGIDESYRLNVLHVLNVKMDEFNQYCTDSVGADFVRREVGPILKFGDFVCHLLKDK